MPKWLPLMRTGEFRDRHGNLYNITAETLKNAQKNYETGNSPAHLVVGHPNRDRVIPSFGLVDKLKAIADTLFFLPKKVVPEFAALVAKGGFPSVSAGFRDKECTVLDHVAFLSGQKPAIDGLAPIAEFSAPEGAGLTELDITACFSAPEFASQEWIGWRLKDIAGVFRKFREYIISKSSLEEADQVIPDWMVENIGRDPPVEPAQFSHEGGSMEYKLLYEQEQAKTAELATKLASAEKRVAEFSAREKSLTDENVALKTKVGDFEEKMVRAEFEAYTEKLIGEKKLLPAQKQQTVDALMTMKRASATPEFSSPEGNGKSPLDLFKANLEAGAFGTIPSGGHTAIKPGPEFSSADDDYEDAGRRARAYRESEAKNGNYISATEAYNHVTKNRQ